MLCKIPKSLPLTFESIEAHLRSEGTFTPLRWGGFGQDQESWLVEAVGFGLESSLAGVFAPLEAPVPLSNAQPVTVLSLPTGIGCSIGGYGGDASLVASLFGEVSGYLIGNPNIVNAGAWQCLPPNFLYVEGFSLDAFLAGQLALRPRPRQAPHRIGLILAGDLTDLELAREMLVIEAAQMIWGLDFVGCASASGFSCQLELQGGLSSGSVSGLESLFAAGEELLGQGATALAVLARMPHSENENAYWAGAGPDPIGGLEAIISHLLSARFLLPCAHAPVWEAEGLLGKFDRRVASELSSFSFLPSVLGGLARAPSLIPFACRQHGDLSVLEVNNFVHPFDCWLGRGALLAASRSWIECYAVRNNFSGLGLTPESLGFGGRVQTFQNYFELAGWLVARGAGIASGALRYLL